MIQVLIIMHKILKSELEAVRQKYLKKIDALKAQLYANPLDAALDNLKNLRDTNASISNRLLAARKIDKIVNQTLKNPIDTLKITDDIVEYNSLVNEINNILALENLRRGL